MVAPLSFLPALVISLPSRVMAPEPGIELQGVAEDTDEDAE